jgi:tetratricopeptide (TPR) repeat protein
LSELGKRHDAEATYRKSLEINESIAVNFADVPDFQVNLGGAFCNFGMFQLEAGQPEPAFKWLQKAVVRLEGVLTKEPRLFTAREFLRNSHMARADALIALGRRDDALHSREQEMALNASLLGPNHFGTLTTMYLLTEEYDAAGRSKDAQQLRKELLKRRQQAVGADAPDTPQPMADLTTEIRNWREDVHANPEGMIPNYARQLTTLSNLASTYALIGQHQAALVLREKILNLRKEQFGSDDSQTLASMHELAESLIACDRGAEAVALIDECIRLVGGVAINANLIPALFDLRIRYFDEQKDAAGCRSTAKMWEGLNPTDAESLYNAARLRGATAAVLAATEESEEATGEADLAMNWLTKAVAAGYGDVAHVKQDKDLHILRDRDDFRELIARLDADASEKTRKGEGDKP